MNAEDSGDRLKAWTSLPQGSSGLVFIIDAQISSFELATGEKKILSSFKWTPNLPFVRQYRLPPGQYDLSLPAPLASVRVEAKEGNLTYVTLHLVTLPVAGQEPALGIQVTASWGPLPEPVGQLLEKANSHGHPEIYTTETLSGIRDNLLLVSTEPPWQIPPPPPPRK